MTAPNCTVDSGHHPIVLSVLPHIKVKAQCVPALSPVNTKQKETKKKGLGGAMKKWPKCSSYNKTQTEKRQKKTLTVMYLTSMSVFLSSSAIISRWNLLNFRWGGRGRRGRRGVGRGIKETRTHANDQRARMRDGARRAIVVNGQAVRRRRVSSRRAIIRGVSLCARRGERPVRGCAYEWVRNKAWERLLCSPSCSRSLAPEWGKRWPSPQPLLRHNQSVNVGSDGRIERVRPSPATMSH